MSKSVLDFLKGKNVFVFDTETTGLPLGSPSGWGSYWDYRMNDKYDSSRIVSIAWASIKNFDRENIDNNNSNNSNILHHIRYPEGFDSIPTTHIHGISLEEALKNGTPFGYILSIYGLADALLDADYIVAHNVKFDYNILMNELHRIVTTNEPIIPISLSIREKANLCIEHIKKLYDTKCVICTGILSTEICKMEFPSKNTYLGKKKNYKMPKLCELYKYYYGKDFENAHSADGDVKALIDCMKMM